MILSMPAVNEKSDQHTELPCPFVFSMTGHMTGHMTSHMCGFSSNHNTNLTPLSFTIGYIVFSLKLIACASSLDGCFSQTCLAWKGFSKTKLSFLIGQQPGRKSPSRRGDKQVRDWVSIVIFVFPFGLHRTSLVCASGETFGRRVLDDLERQKGFSPGGQFCGHTGLPDPTPPLRRVPRQNLAMVFSVFWSRQVKQFLIQQWPLCFPCSKHSVAKITCSPLWFPSAAILSDGNDASFNAMLSSSVLVPLCSCRLFAILLF